MSNQELLDRLVETWHAQWLLEEDTLPEVICRDHPDLLPEFRRRIEQIKLLDELIGVFEERRAAGENPQPDEICREHLDLLERFQAEVKKLDLFDSAFGESADDEPDGVDSVGPFCHGRYNVEGVLNKGGQGIIYTATDKELGRTVVVKGPGRRGLGREALGRLEQEAHTTGRLEHPGVVPVYGFGHDQSGKPYYAMKFIDGETLSASIKRFHTTDYGALEPSRKSLDFQKLLRNFVTVCQTIAYAHSRGIVHRDIKPINIMLGKFGEVWVVDWGLAKRSPDLAHTPLSPKAPVVPVPEASAPDASTIVPSNQDSVSTETAWRFSHSHGIKGTLFYMSPEQAEARNHEVGPLSDIYSLGATMYELLTGRPPVLGDTSREVLDRVIAGHIAPAREVKTEIPPALEAICAKAMRLVATDRYASAADLAAEIERFLADEPVKAWREPWSLRAGRWLRRHRTVMTGAAAAVLVGMVGLGMLAAQQAIAKNRLDQKNAQLNTTNEKLDNKNSELNVANSKLQVANRNEQAAANKARDEEQEARRQEVLAKERAEAERLAKEEAKQLLYFSRIALARSEWLSNNVRRAKQVLLSCDETQRGWEWRFLSRLCDSQRRKLDADWAVNCMAQSQNGRFIAAGRSDGVVAVWVDFLGSGEYIRIPKDIYFRPQESPDRYRIAIAAVALQPTGGLLAAASWTMSDVFGNKQRTAPEVRICQTASGVVDFTIPVEAQSLAFSPDGATLAVGLHNGTIELWSVAEKKKVGVLLVGRGGVCGVAFSSDGKSLAAAEYHGAVKVWTLKLGEEPTQEFEFLAEAPVHCVTLSPDGLWLASGNEWGEVDVWNLKALREKDESKRTRHSLVVHTAPVRSLSFHPEQSVLASASDDRTIKYWNVEFKQYETIRGHEDEVKAICFAPGGTSLISASRDRTLRFWDLREEQEAATRPGQSFGMSADGRYLATARPSSLDPMGKMFNESVFVWNVATGLQIRRFRGHKGYASCVALSADGKLAASGGNDSTRAEALVWQVETGEVVRSFSADGKAFSRIALSPSSKLLAATTTSDVFADRQCEMKVWNLETSKLLYTINVGKQAPSSLEFDKQEKLIVVASEVFEPVRLFDVQTGQEVLRLGFQYSASFDPTGRILVTTAGSENEGGIIRLWNVETGAKLYELSGHSDTVLAAAFSKDGTRLATGGRDGTVRVWDLGTRQEILMLPHAGIVNSVAFGGNDESLISSSGNQFNTGKTKIWRAPFRDQQK